MHETTEAMGFYGILFPLLTDIEIENESVSDIFCTKTKFCKKTKFYSKKNVEKIEK